MQHDNFHQYCVWCTQKIRTVFQIFNFKTLLISVLAVLSTYLCIRYSIVADFPLTLIATAIVFPVVFSINGAYKRREKALEHYASMKAHSKAIYFCTRDWLDHPSQSSLDKIRTLLDRLMKSFKLLFSGSITEMRDNEQGVYICFSDLSKFINMEIRNKKVASGELSRCNQYLSKIILAFEDAKHIFQYRTPRSIKTFSSVFLTLLPIVYGPFFAHEAKEYSAHLTYVLPILFSVILVSLSNIQEHLENPFDGVGEDDIKINIDEFLDRLHD